MLIGSNCQRRIVDHSLVAVQAVRLLFVCLFWGKDLRMVVASHRKLFFSIAFICLVKDISV